MIGDWKTGEEKLRGGAGQADHEREHTSRPDAGCTW